MTKFVWSSPEALELAASAGVTDPELAMRLLARRLLAADNVQTLPVPLQRLYPTVGIRKVRQIETVLEGGLTRNDDGSFDVIVRADRPPVRRRFSLAHEIGHLLFYTHAPAAKRARALSGEVAPEEEERLCNVAAEELLVPQAYLDALVDSGKPPTAVTAQVIADCEVSTTAALIRVAARWPHAGELQLWAMRDGRWELTMARRTGGQRRELSSFVVEAWGDKAVHHTAQSWIGEGFIYSATRRERILCATELVKLTGRGATALVFHHPIRRSSRAVPTTLEAVGRDRVRKALAAKPRKGCSECGGAGWIDPARRTDPARLCGCRFDQGNEASA